MESIYLLKCLNKLKQKAPNANVIHADILEYTSQEKYDYIFISSSSVSLFTDINVCKQILGKIKNILADDGTFVFAVDTVANIFRMIKIITLQCQ